MHNLDRQLVSNYVSCDLHASHALYAHASYNRIFQECRQSPLQTFIVTICQNSATRNQALSPWPANEFKAASQW